MASTSSPSPAMVRSAQDGDLRAVRTLVADHLPLLYTVVVRAAGPSVDVDDVLARTVALVAAGMPGLVEPDGFRPWLLSTALRFLWTAEQAGPVGAYWPVVVAVDGSDQREEANTAVRWLVPDDRELLSLWWLEVSGELSRAEVAATSGLTPIRTELRLRQIQARFEDARTAIRTLGATPPCAALVTLLQHWDRRPSDRQRRQIARHATGCPTCSPRAGDLIPADRLLRGSPLLTPPLALVAALLAQCERAPASAAPWGSGALLDRGRRATAIPWVATSARILAVTVAVILLGTTLATYAGNRKASPVPTGLTRTTTAYPSPSVSASENPSVSASESPSENPSPTPSRPASSARAVVPSPTGNGQPDLSGSRSLRSVANPDRYVQIINDLAFVGPVSRSSSAADRRAATFAVVPGLADPACRSFRDASGQYLRHFRFRVQLDPDDKSQLFREDTTFCPRPGTTRESVSFRSINYPDRFLHLRGDELWIDKSDGTAGFLMTASFTVVEPWA